MLWFLVGSLEYNQLKPEGAKHVADAIATNTTLKSLKYALSHPQPCCQYALTALALCNHLCACSLNDNALTNYGRDMSGVLQLAESLKVNSSLTSLSYVLHSLNSSPKCQDPLTSPLVFLLQPL